MNLILVLTDQQPWNTWGCLGSTMARTPTIDGLARQGVLFRRFRAVNPVCMPARAGVFTGLMPTVSGCWNNGVPLPRSVPTIADHLSAAGWATAHIGKLHLEPTIDRDGGSHPYGFAHAEIAEGDQQLTHDAYFGWLRRTHPWRFLEHLDQLFREGHEHAYRNALPDALTHTAWCTDRAIRWLQNHRPRDRPFLLSVGFFDPHHAFNPAEPWFSRFADAAVEWPALRTLPDGLPEDWRRFHAEKSPLTADDDRLAGIIRSVHAMTAQIDHHLGRLVAAVQAAGMASDTVFLITADHGEFLGSRGLLHKSHLLCDDLLRVPCLVAKADGQQRGWIDDGLADGLDVLPTALELAGLVDGSLPGRTLVDHDLNPRPRGSRPHTWAACDGGDDPSRGWQRRIDDGRYALITGPEGVRECYDLEADPLAQHNRARDAALAEVRARLSATLADTPIPARPLHIRRTAPW